MNAAATIQAAVDKLESERVAATDGPWFPWHSESGRGNSSVDAATWDPDNPDMVVEGEKFDVDLIVTLHRTIDAQLAILLAAFGGAKDLDQNAYPDEPAMTQVALILARAILGES